MTIGERIKIRREQLGMTQEEVAKKCGYKSRSSINKIELSRDLPLRKVQLMADALETTPSELMGWTEDIDVLREQIVNETLDLFQSEGERDSDIIRKQEVLNYKTSLLHKLSKEKEKIDATDSDDVERKERINKALDFLSHYEDAPDEIQDAIRRLLKYHQQDS